VLKVIAIFTALLIHLISNEIDIEIERGVKLFELKKFKDSFDTLMPFAKKGDAKAQFYIGLIYDMGDIGLMDKAKAVEWYEKSAKQGFAKAQYDMGVMLSKGEGINKDLKMAKMWYELSAKQGNGYAMYNLGVIYHRGYGVDKNISIAKEWYRKAIEKNISVASFNLGTIYYKKRNFKEASLHYLKASKLGNAKAMFYLAWMYQHGFGVEKSLKDAKRWYKLSAIKGNRRSALNYSSILMKEGNTEEAEFWKKLSY
jgi:TPR repeat protein